ncbi:LytR/AlgR family response regulator transcription factor [Enterococcus crotali]|uniref:LytR/AlgR family response regulator transcription factor n=1 Tax=Enterococcus crotali TaxID=1453587 RepID=UPI0004720857|nr:LytTR family DNA-binding domain-containing protein [Enterococcus crotali]
MSIFILEDDIIQAQALKRLVEEICQRKNIDIETIHVTNKGEQLIEQISKSLTQNLYFLDIEIKKSTYSGFEVAKKIRTIDDTGLIVFITTHSEFAPISYQYMVSALTFIEKMTEPEKLKIEIEKCLIKYQQLNQKQEISEYLLINNSHSTIKVPISDFYYVMTTEAHRLALFTQNRSLRFYGELKEVEQKKNQFIRCHQSYVVNLDKICEIDHTNRELILSNEMKIPVSRRLLKSVTDRWIER